MSELHRVYNQVFKEVNLASERVELLSGKSLKDFDKMLADMNKASDAAFKYSKTIKDAVLGLETSAKSKRIKSQAYIDEANKLINDIKVLGLEVPKQLTDGMEQSRVAIDQATKAEKAANTIKGLL